MNSTGEVPPELWRRVKDGESEAFVDLYQATARAVFGFCLRRTGSWETAEDCTSLVFLEAWRLRRTLRAEGAGMAWLFGISHNVVRNQTRARRRHQALLRRLPLREDTATFEVDAAERIDAERRARTIVGALGQLQQKERDILTLAASADLTSEEIATALNIPVGTVKSRLHRARRHLAELSESSAPVPTRPVSKGAI